jgi:uncharacterized membrane protein YvbJ
MVTCKYCGQKNKDGNLRCSNCGKPLTLIWNETSKNIFKKDSNQLQKDDFFDDGFKNNSLYKEDKIYDNLNVQRNQKFENSNHYIEWDVVVATALIAIISTSIFNKLFSPFGYIMALLISLFYLLKTIKIKTTLVIVLPLSFIVTCAITAFLSL